MLSDGHAEIFAKPPITRLTKFQPSVPGHVAYRCLLPRQIACASVQSAGLSECDSHRSNLETKLPCGLLGRR